MPTVNGTSGGTPYTFGTMGSLRDSTGANCSAYPDTSTCADLSNPASMAARPGGGSSGEGGALMSAGKQYAGPAKTDNMQQALKNNNTAYTILPNPSDGNITIKQQEPADGTARVRVMDMLGAVVYDGTVQFAGGRSSISISKVARGMYLLELTDNKGITGKYMVIVER